jgi:hypothetical protein
MLAIRELLLRLAGNFLAAAFIDGSSGIFTISFIGKAPCVLLTG